MQKEELLRLLQDPDVCREIFLIMKNGGKPNVQASAMRDAAGDIILKLVNCTEKAQKVEIRGVAGSGTRTVFTGPDRLAHNSPAEPEALKETSAPFKLDGTDTLPPLSLVIYRLR